MKGLRSDSDLSFPQLFAPIADEFDRLFWLINLQSGPFIITDKPDFEELDRALDSYYVEVLRFENTSFGLWRPGVLSRFEGMMVEDEWSCWTGILGPESRAKESAEVLFRTKAYSEFLAEAERHAEVTIIMIGYRWWEVYSRHEAWLDRLRLDCQYAEGMRPGWREISPPMLPGGST